MSEMTLRERAEELFQFALKRTSDRPALQNLHRELLQCYQRLEQPMRVAIVGLIKAGKSTTINVLLGEALVATGTVEATFNVNWLKYGEKPSLRVHFKDGHPPENKSVEELTALTLRADANRTYLVSIKHIEVFYPNRILQTFNLIDTPGLESYYEDDSQNTRDFLQLHGQALTEVTQTEATNADAVLYLFSQGLNKSGQSVMKEFQGPTVGRATPVNAIGVLTKVDFYWPAESEPLAVGHKITQRLMSDHPQLHNLFYTIYPVSGFLALGAQTLTPSEFEVLSKLAALPEERLDRLIKDVRRISREYPEEPNIPPVAERQRVLNRLGQYGMWLACRIISSGVTEQEQLAKELIEHSGMPQLKDLIASHFGKRAFLIKLSTGLRQITAACFREKLHQTAAELEIVKEVGRRVEEIESLAHDFNELRVLRSHYERKLSFEPDEVKQLLEATGENGSSCAQRLGMDERSTIAEMLPVAKERMRYWRLRASDQMGADSQTLEAAVILAHSYERIVYHVNEARKHLYL